MANISLYQVVAVEPGKAPRVGEQGEWHSYVIANRHTRVAGRRQGTRDHVRRHAESIADRLNDRARTGHSMWAPRKRRKAG